MLHDLVQLIFRLTTYDSRISSYPSLTRRKQREIYEFGHTE